LFKFLHAADIHLDSPPVGLQQYEGAPIGEIRGATRRAFQNLVELALNEEVAFVLIAGDLYDGDWPDYNTGLFFAAQMTKLHEADIKVFIVAGNHDAASQITKRLRMPDNVKFLSVHKPETVILEDIGVAVHGQGFSSRAVTDNLSLNYPDPLRSLFNLGLLHTSLNGREGHEPYAPCSLDNLVSKNYNYWALGHVHKREVLSSDPWAFFPGNLQGRHAKETGSKGAILVMVEDGMVASAEHCDLDVVRWEVCEIDTTMAASGHDVVDLVRETIASQSDAAGGRILAVRVRLVGTSEAHGHLSSDPEHWTNQIRATVFDISNDVWIEKVVFHTKTPIDLETLLEHDDPVGGLLRTLQKMRSKNQNDVRELLKEFGDLKNKLPAEYRQLDEAIDFNDPASLTPLIEDVEQFLVPRLLERTES